MARFGLTAADIRPARQARQNPMWRDMKGNPAIKAWSDEYSNLLAVLKWEKSVIKSPTLPQHETP